MTSRVAVIDLGTNTFNVLIADVSANKFTSIFSEEIPVKLGEGGINAGLITDEAWARGISAIKYIHKKITLYNCNRVKAVATSAIRSAANGAEFKLAVKAESGIDIEVIDGNHEAQLIFDGVRQGVSLNAMTLIMDIGGGSVEFIICDQDQVYWKESYAVGAARLKEKFHHSDPICQEDILAIEEHLERSLTSLFNQCTIHKPQCLIGSAGAFETFAELVSIRFNHPHNKNDSQFTFNLDEFYEIAETLLKSSHSYRENMPGLVAFRVDMIVSATILTLFILQKTGLKALKLSSYALKEGMLTELINKID